MAGRSVVVGMGGDGLPPDLAYDTMSPNDRRRVRAVLEHVGDERHVSWANLDLDDRERGQMNAVLVQTAMASSP